jgi:hypothetical protein
MGQVALRSLASFAVFILRNASIVKSGACLPEGEQRFVDWLAMLPPLSTLSLPRMSHGPFFTLYSLFITLYSFSVSLAH